MSQDLQERLKISIEQLDSINHILLNPDMQIIKNFTDVVEKYGTPEEINAKAEEAGKLENLLKVIEQTKPEYLQDRPGGFGYRSNRAQWFW